MKETLPDDVLLAIFDGLTLKDRLVAETVCRRWWNLMPMAYNQPRFVLRVRSKKTEPVKEAFPVLNLCQAHNVSERSEKICMSREQACNFLSRYCHGTSLCIQSKKASHIYFCIEIVKREWYRLKNLEIEHLQLRNSCLMKELAVNAYASLITRIYTEGEICYISMGAKAMKEFTNLKSLEVHSLTFINKTLIKNLPESLTTFWFPRSWFMSGNEKCLQLLVERFGKRLQQLALRNVSRAQLHQICQGFPNLLSLEIHIPPSFPLESLAKLDKLQKIENLGIITMGKLSSDDFFSDKEGDSNDSCPNQNSEIVSPSTYRWSKNDSSSRDYAKEGTEDTGLGEKEKNLNDEDEDERFPSDYDESDESTDSSYDDFYEDLRLVDISGVFVGRSSLQRLKLCCQFKPKQLLDMLSIECVNLLGIYLDCVTKRRVPLEKLSSLRKLKLLEVALTSSTSFGVIELLKESNSLCMLDFDYNPSHICTLSQLLKVMIKRASCNPLDIYYVQLIGYETMLKSLDVPSFSSNIKIFG